tara:strand:+ start:191 stop:394 length:204 start_codon:yes stop_codon:yes gene_type:complete
MFKIGDIVMDDQWTEDLDENDVDLPIGIIIQEESFGEVLIRWTTAYLDEPVQVWDAIRLKHLGGNDV